MSAALAGHTAQIHRKDVLVLLYAANRDEASAAALLAMRRKRKSLDTPQAEALWHGAWQLTQTCETNVEQLRQRGGLLHFRHAQVLHTGYGSYVVDKSLNEVQP